MRKDVKMAQVLIVGWKRQQRKSAETGVAEGGTTGRFSSNPAVTAEDGVRLRSPTRLNHSPPCPAGRVS